MGVLTGAGVRILLVGTGEHTAGSELADLPAVSATVTELATTVVQRCGAQPAQVRTLLDPASPLVFGRELTAAAAQAEDVLVVCYLGHGLLDAHGELYLATQATDHLRDGLGYTALPYAALREELTKSRARSVIVLLDCCFSGRATGSPYPADLDGFAATRSPGGYLLASAAPEELALAPVGERYTAFTGELIRLLHDGDPAGPRELTLDHLYRCLDRALPEQGRPRPRRYAAGRTGELVVAPNPAFQPPVLSRSRPREQAPAGADAICPYRGLKAYDVADARYFFGREALTQRLVARLAEQLPGAGTLVVIGPSGSGKSSLLRAGLIPALDAGLPNTPGSQAWPRLVFTPGAHPIAALASRLSPLAGDPADVLGVRLAADPAELSAVAGAVLSRHVRGENAPGSRLVLVVDQFEEIFTTCENNQERRAFLDALSTAAASTTLVVLGLRAGFYAHCAAEPQLVEALQHSQLIVTPMSTGELRAAIEKPATQAGLQLEHRLAERILHDLGTSDHTEHASGNGGLPLLSHALFETWQQRDGDLLTLAGYEATGGIWEAVTRSAEDRYATLTATEQETAQLVLLRLVHLGVGGTGDTPRRVRRADLPGTEAAARVLATFADARLITLGADTAEIVHEALLRAWPRLRRWIDTDRAGNLIRQELHEAAAGWDRDGRDPALLYRGSRLEAARTWATSTSNRGDVSPAASAFLIASTQQERRAARLRRAVLVVLSVLALVASGAAIFAFEQNGTAQRERDNAIFNQITAQADQLRGTDVSLAAQLSITAYRMRPTLDLNTALVSIGNATLSTPLTGHTSFAFSVAFSPDGRTLATGNGDQNVRLWNVTDPTHPTPLGPPLTGHTNYVRSVAFSPDGRTLATGSEDRTVRLWNVPDPTHPTPLGQPLTDHTNTVHTVVFSPDGHTLASSSWDQTVRLWNVTDPTHPTPLGPALTGHTDRVYSVAFSPDGHTLASGSDDNTVRLWNVTDPAHPTPLGPPLAGHTDYVRSVAFSPDGHTLASSSRDRTVRLWNVIDPARPTPLSPPLKGHTNSVYSVAFSPDGHTLASSSTDRHVRLWNLADPANPAELGPPLTGHTNFVFSVIFSPDGRTLVSSGDNTVRLWNIPSSLLTGHTNAVVSVVFSPDRRTLASASDDNTVRLWNVSDPAHPTPLGPPLTGHTDAVSAVVFSPDGHTLASASKDQTVRLWNVTDPAHPSPLGPPLTGHTHRVSSAVFSPDGHTLATGSEDRTVRLWNVTDPTHHTALGQPMTGHTGMVDTVVFSPDGRTLASGSRDYTARLWNVTDPAHPTPWGQALTDHTNPVYSMAFSPDGHTLATGSADQNVRLWNVTDPAHPTPLGPPLTSHTNRVTAVAFSPDGYTLATGSFDSTVRLWNVTDPVHPTALGQSLTGHTDWVFSVVFSPDGHTLATGSTDRTVRLWETNVEQAIQRICATTRNTLTPEKWKQYVSPDLPYRPPCL
ncbi:MAG: caspase, EACC1-associated type [Pseudonocardiaceae bacterium]